MAILGRDDLSSWPTCGDGVLTDTGALSDDPPLGEVVAEGGEAVGRSTRAKICIIDLIDWCEVNLGDELVCSTLDIAENTTP